MDRELAVYVDLNRVPIQVGRLWTRAKQGKQSSSFEYAPEWLAHPAKFALGPSLPLAPGQFQAIDRDLFNCFTDSAPDRWGKMLMRHHERNRAKEAGTTARSMLEVDFLTGVDDQTRMGAIRLKDVKGDAFLTSTGSVVPPVIELKNLLSATDRIERGKPRKTDVALVLAPGASLGGVRPKATVRDRDGQLWLAKFPWVNDDWPVIQWEWATLIMAEKAGVTVPKFRVESVGSKTALMMSRFDRRADGTRLPYMSAFTALDAKEHQEDRSYLELVDALRQLGDAPREDLHQLFRRMVFNLLVSNVDDHVRNHGFRRGGDGWRLSPAFDMNPCPVDVKGRIHAMAFNEDDHSSSLDTCISVADYFALKKSEALAIAADVAGVTTTWADVAKQCKLSKFDIERMESAFEHDDLTKALANRTASPVKGPAKAANTAAASSPKAPARKRAPAPAKKAKGPTLAKKRKSAR